MDSHFAQYARLPRDRSSYRQLIFISLLLTAIFSSVFLVSAQPLIGSAAGHSPAAPVANQQMAIWAFSMPKQDNIFVDNGPIDPTTYAVDSQPDLVMRYGDIDDNGKDGKKYTDTAGTIHYDTLAAAWNSVDDGQNDPAEWIVTLETTGWEDIAFRFDYKSAKAPEPPGPSGYELAYRVGADVNWTTIGQQNMSADDSWHISEVNLSAINALDDQSKVQLRFSQLNAGGANGEFKFDNFEITGSQLAAPGAPTIAVSSSTTSYLNMIPPSGSNKVTATKDDPTDPARTLGIDFAIDDPDDDPLTVTATSDNDSVVPNDNSHLTLVDEGGGIWNLKITPDENDGIGMTAIEVTANDGSNAGSYTIQYASSAAADNAAHDPSLAAFHTGLSDASSAIAVGDDYMFVANDELIQGKDNIYLFDRHHSGYHYYAFDAAAAVNPGGNEMDVEASTSVGDTIYWLTSMGNNKDGECRPDRNRLFATDIVGSGQNATLDYIGRYDHLRADLINWDKNNNHGLGANYFGLEDSAYCVNDPPGGGIPPKSDDLNGFNVEGLAMAPSSDTTGFIAFRAPITPPGDRQLALIIPITNMTTILEANGSTPEGSAQFGDPIELDLGGRGIRGIERNADDEYLIIAGPATESSSWTNDAYPFVLYTWTGDSADTPLLLNDVDLTQINAFGSWESIVEVPSPLTGSTVQLLVDNGTTDWYGTGNESKEWSPNWQKFRSEWVALSGSPAPDTIVVTNTDDSGPGSLPQAVEDIAPGGKITFDPALNGETIVLFDYLSIDKDMIIDGLNAPGLAISGGDDVQVFYISDGVKADLANLTIEDGWTNSGGGGVENNGDLTILNSTIKNNTADYGAGIKNTSIMRIENSTISGNNAVGTDAAESGGGAIDQYGGDSQLTIIFSTITDNSSPDNDRDGIWLEEGVLNINNTIVADNGINNCVIEDAGTFNAAEENLDDDGTCPDFSESDVSDPGLDSLADNGGPTETHALLEGSPAIDKINSCSKTPQDQRGITRPQGSGCDIGSFELKSQENNTAPQAFNQNVVTQKNQSKSIILSATDPDGDPLDYFIVSEPGHGDLSGTPPNVVYEPDPDYTGPDSFEFKANDSLVDSNIATVSISVTTGGGSGNIYMPMITVPNPPLIASGSNWRYLDNGSDQGSGWRQASFNDSSWKSGQAQLGYGDGDETTVINYGPNGQDKYITTYFRHSFNVSSPGKYSQLTLELLRDDGAVVYLNNQEIARSNMPAGSINYKTEATNAVANAAENTWYPFAVNPSLLVSGSNILAVEIHQDRPNSSDISFDLALKGTAGSQTETVTVAAIGDYGRNDAAGTEQEVADMIAGWSPDLVITMGDNSYGNNNIDDNIGKFYAQYIGNYKGGYGSGSSTNHFFPAIGNHDYTDGAGIDAYLDYFTLPPGPGGDERYYDFVQGPLHFFVLDSNPANTGGKAPGDGTTPNSVQGQWLQNALAQSNEAWNIVYFHHAPYSTSDHGGQNASTTMRWPFAAWGASAVLAGHDHTYERFQIGAVPYFVNGVGVKPTASRICHDPTAGYNGPDSEICIDGEAGAMRIEASDCRLEFKFYTSADNQQKDQFVIDNCL